MRFTSNRLQLYERLVNEWNVPSDRSVRSNCTEHVFLYSIA